MAGMAVATPAAFAEGCSTDHYGNRTCTAEPSSGGTVSLHHYAYGNKMQGKDSLNRLVHLDRYRRDGSGWDGPIGMRNGSTDSFDRAGTAWRACVNVGGGRYHCTVWA
ncbi:hypothetical protein GCM10022247_36380 [Allokutzneria multivorans]|uniref:Uncharacterized protein n=2 Tax=Allokutzneria multivorans TaxID=1142134 RepID=A0ABP7SFE1_9PSEU